MSDVTPRRVLGIETSCDETSAAVVYGTPTDMPAFGLKTDAIPGRLNETWFKAEREGLYYGQCSKLCGKDHAFMPIAVRVVSEQNYQAWVADAKKKFAATPSSNDFADNAAIRQ